MGVKLPYDTLNEVRDRLTDVCPSMTRYGDLEEANYSAQASDLTKVNVFIFIIYYGSSIIFFFFWLQDLSSQNVSAPLNVKQIALEDFYMTDSISRSSPTMAKCIQAVRKQKESKYYESRV